MQTKNKEVDGREQTTKGKAKTVYRVSIAIRLIKIYASEFDLCRPLTTVKAVRDSNSTLQLTFLIAHREL